LATVPMTFLFLYSRATAHYTVPIFTRRVGSVQILVLWLSVWTLVLHDLILATNDALCTSVMPLQLSWIMVEPLRLEFQASAMVLHSLSAVMVGIVCLLTDSRTLSVLSKAMVIIALTHFTYEAPKLLDVVPLPKDEVTLRETQGILHGKNMPGELLDATALQDTVPLKEAQGTHDGKSFLVSSPQSIGTQTCPGTIGKESTYSIVAHARRKFTAYKYPQMSMQNKAQLV